MKLTMHYVLCLPLFRNFLIGISLISGILFYLSSRTVLPVEAQAGAVTTVSAASFATDSALAPDSIVAAFGPKLATSTVIATTQPLPTSLGGSSVRVNGQLAPLFFVSPVQINYVIPTGIATGTATVVVNAGDGTMSQGTIQIAPAAPGIFTANADGFGVPAAVLVRVARNGSQTIEPVMQFDSASSRQIPRPIDLGPEGERVFVVLFLSGVRGASDANGDGNVRETVRLVIGGLEVIPDFVGKQGMLTGLDQMNAEIPRSLIGRGRINLAITAVGAAVSNLAEIEIAARPGASPPQVNNFNPASVLAGNDMTIAGSGFSVTPGENLVRIGGSEAQVQTATQNQLMVKVPFGVASGPLSIQTLQGEGSSTSSVPVRTSISGFLEDTSRNPISGATIRLRNSTIMTASSTEGSFILPDIPFTGLALVDIDPSTVAGGLPYPAITVKQDVLSNRDNMIDRPVPLEPSTGPSLTVGSGSSGSIANEESSEPVEITAPDAPTGIIQVDGVTLEVPNNATAIFPNGATSGKITLTSVRSSRTPVNLPPGVFSSTIVQITPFRVRLTPGGKLTFPNLDGLVAGSQARIYKFDQAPNSPTIGSFINVGTATVTADGKFVETPAGAIQETSYYFVAIPRQTTTIIGRVVERDGVTPVRRALVNARGQEAFTDGNGGFILRQVPANAAENLSVEASVHRPDGRIDRGQSGLTPAVIGGTTNVGNIVLPAVQSNLPPVLIGLPTSLTVTENTDTRLNFQALDPNRNQALRVTLDAPPFVSIVPGNLPLYTMVLSPKAGTAGSYKIAVTAIDDTNLSQTVSFTLRVNRPPIANAQTVNVGFDKPETITLTGSDPDGDPVNFLIVTPPKNGTLSGALPTVTYTPNKGFSGQDEFFFKTNDGFADSPSTRVIILVQPSLNRAPTITVPGTQNVPPGGAVNFQVSGTDPDTNQTLTLTASGLPQGATFTTNGQNPIAGAFSWKAPPPGTPPVTVTVSFTVTDNGNPSLSDSKSVTIRVISIGFN